MRKLSRVRVEFRSHIVCAWKRGDGWIDGASLNRG
jgi:hypothetical protein